MDRMNKDKKNRYLIFSLSCISCPSLFNFSSSFIKLLVVLCFLAFAADAQELPDKIRGYKVKKADITIGSKGAGNSEDDVSVEVRFDEPEVASVGLTGIMLELGGEFIIYGQSGMVDFITFKGFKVNGIKVDIEEYKASFDFKKGETVKLEKPVEIFVRTTQALRGVLGEYNESKDKWKVTGRVFVFGRFNKMGFKFKRVIPVDVDMTIENPINNIGARMARPCEYTRK